MNKLTTGQAAKRLQYSIKTVQRLIDFGKLKAERLSPTGQNQILEKDLVEFAQANGITLLKLDDEE